MQIISCFSGAVCKNTMKGTIRNILIFTGIAVVAWLGIHHVQEFRFYNLECSDLFLYDWADIAGRLKQAGGLALVASSFLTQFMGIPYVGAAIATLIYMLSAWILCRILGKSGASEALAGFSFLPSAFLFLCLENEYYLFNGHVAFLLVLAALWGYVSLPRQRWGLRLVAGVAALPLLYHAVGSAAVVFAVSAFVVEISSLRIRGLWAVAYPALMVIAAFAYVRTGLADSWEAALTPYMYYNYPSTYFFPLYAWAVVPLLVMAAGLLPDFSRKPKAAVAVSAVGLVFSFILAGNFYTQVHSRSTYRLIQEQHWAYKGDWDSIIETADRRQPTYLISYLNLALAQKNQLLENFRYYNPQQIGSVMLPVPNIKLGMSLQSCVYLSWGYVSAARQSAFDANMVTSGMRNPLQLKVLVQTNMAAGDHEVAQKYRNILSRTLFYREWAENVPELDVKLPSEDEYVRHDGMIGDMEDILAANPSNRIMSQFYELYKILEVKE